IFARAPALTFTPRSVTADEISPLLSTFAGPLPSSMRPAATSESRVISPPATSARSSSATSWLSTRNGGVKPRFGTRRVIGIWPPSKCGFPPPGPPCPVRALLPLWPLPDVLPVPLPGPRPRRFRLRCEPGGCIRLSSPMRGTPESFASAVFFLVVAMLLALLALHRRYLDEVAYLIDLTTQARRDLLDHDVLMVLETERAQRGAMLPRAADPAADLLD